MRIKSFIAASGVLAIFAAFLAAPALAQQQSGPVAPVCANCHEAQWKAIDLSPHGAKNDAQGSMCQACHGDASEHLKDPMKAKPANPFGKGHTVNERTAVCLGCHASNRNLAFWTSGKHQLNEVTCTNCHSIHGKSLAPSINKYVTTFLPNQAEICWQCHQPIRAANFKPSHHPIIEGKVKCTDCHNPHGAITPAMLKQPTINDQCYSCHADKRGPYVYNHPPVEENCVTCHNPHGSVHARAPERVGAEPLPGLPRRVAAPRHGVRRGRRLQLRGRRHHGERGDLCLSAESDRAAQPECEHPPRVARVPELPQQRSTAATHRAAAASSSRDKVGRQP